MKRAGLMLAALFLSVLMPAQALAADSNVNVKVCYPTAMPQPVITSPVDGTTTEDSSVLMQGTTTPSTTVYAYRGGTQVGFVSADPAGIFEISVPLNIGSNALRAAILNDCDDPTFSDTVTVVREAVVPPTDPEPEPEPTPGEEAPATPSEPIGGDEQPAGGGQGTGITPGQKLRPSKPGSLEIVEPRDGLIVTQSTVRITGFAPPNTRVRILLNNDVVAEVMSDDEGRFTVSVTLREGDNQIFAAIGTQLNTRLSQPVSIFYDPPGHDSFATSARWYAPIILTGLATGALMYAIFMGPGFDQVRRLPGRKKKL